jgi:hypothetical protein
MLVIFDFNQSKNNSIYTYGIINIIWYYKQFLDGQNCCVKYKGCQQQTKGNLQKVGRHIVLLGKGQIEL